MGLPLASKAAIMGLWDYLFGVPLPISLVKREQENAPSIANCLSRAPPESSRTTKKRGSWSFRPAGFNTESDKAVVRR